jgi:ribose 5-phosphate isomerase B
VDYPDIAEVVCANINDGTCDKGILLCGTGIGISMSANKIRGILAALCHSEFDAKMCREHNNANVMCLGGRTMGPNISLEMVKLFLNTPSGGERHQRRVDKIMALEYK